jgi:hypothetical protein
MPADGYIRFLFFAGSFGSVKTYSMGLLLLLSTGVMLWGFSSDLDDKQTTFWVIKLGI